MTKLVRLFSSITLLVLSFVFVSQIALAVTFPTSTGVVNDFAGLMSYSEKASLETTIKNFEAQTTNEIVLVIVNDFQGLDPFTYSQQLFDAWKIGKATKDNGVLLLIGPKAGYVFPERGEIFINVGKGLEGAMPDSITGSIIRNELVPQFQAKSYAAGINNAINAIMKATRGEYTAVGAGATGAVGAAGTTTTSSNPIVFVGIFVLFIIVAIIASRFSKKDGKGGKGSGTTGSASTTGSAFKGGSSTSTSHFGGGKSGGAGAGGSW